MSIVIEGKDIKSLGELREACKEEQGLETVADYLDEGELYQWLCDHFYEREAEQIKHLHSHRENWLCKLSEALGLPFDPLRGQIKQEDEEYQKRMERIKEMAEKDAEKLPADMNLVAINQEELAALLRTGQKKIYLCAGQFSIPLSKSGVHYVGINQPAIENAVTEELYQKAGITLESIEMPDSVDAATREYALKAAMKNGYDPFYEEHSDLACELHRKMQNVDYYEYYELPKDDSAAFEEYPTLSAAKQALRDCLRKTYDAGSALFDVHSGKCIIHDIVKFYAKFLEKYFDTFKAELKEYCEKTGHMEQYNEIGEVVAKMKEHMQRELTDELEDSHDYYAMYMFEYFYNQVEIEEFDSSSETDLLWSIVETILSDTRTYSFPDILSALCEMEQDVNDRAESLQNVAKKCYDELVSEIERNMEILGKDMDAVQENESIREYLKRNIRMAC